MKGPIHFTTLRHMAQSPAHFKAHFDARDPALEEKLEVGEPLRAALPAVDKSTPAMNIGIAVHNLVLLGRAEFLVWDGKRQGNDWKEFAAQHEGKTILNETEFATAQAVADAAMKNTDLRRLVEGTLFEQRELSMQWQVGDRACAGRADAVLSHTMGYVFELKTSSSSEPNKTRRHALSMGYHAQLAWYQNGCKQNGFQVPDAFMGVVETKPPYPVTVFKLTPRLLEDGERLWRSWFEMMRVCEDAHHWPEYTQAIIPLDVDEMMGMEFEDD